MFYSEYRHALFIWSIKDPEELVQEPLCVCPAAIVMVGIIGGGL